ncbi:MAG: CsgG/HfaB family protein [Desulfatitalea sp.]
MKKAFPLTLFALVSMVAGLRVISVYAGQVVPPETKQWASQTVAQEKQLNTVTKPNSVAVLYFQNPSDQPELAPLQKGLTIMLISDLAKLDVVTVIERTELQALVEELGFGQSGLVDADSAPRVGRLLQAQYLVGGVLNSDSTRQLSIKGELLDVAPGKSAGRLAAKGSTEQIFDLEKQLLGQIVTALKLELTPDQKAALSKPMSRDREALMDLFKAVDAGDHQQFDQAEQLYSSALRRDPNLALAKDSLEELKTFRVAQAQGIAGAKQEGATPGEKSSENLEQRARLLRSTRQNTSFTTDLKPATPVSRVPSPAAVEPRETRSP